MIHHLHTAPEASVITWAWLVLPSLIWCLQPSQFPSLQSLKWPHISCFHCFQWISAKTAAEMTMHSFWLRCKEGKAFLLALTPLTELYAQTCTDFNPIKELNSLGFIWITQHFELLEFKLINTVTLTKCTVQTKGHTTISSLASLFSHSIFCAAVWLRTPHCTCRLKSHVAKKAPHRWTSAFWSFAVSSKHYKRLQIRKQTKSALENWLHSCSLQRSRCSQASPTRLFTGTHHLSVLLTGQQACGYAMGSLIFKEK